MGGLSLIHLIVLLGIVGAFVCIPLVIIVL
jgi:hypothetical protein